MKRAGDLSGALRIIEVSSQKHENITHKLLCGQSLLLERLTSVRDYTLKQVDIRLVRISGR